MKFNPDKPPAASENRRINRCLSCGTSENMARRKYCSIECRQRLRHNLNLRTGLLKALNIRYATFYFTQPVIVLDMLPYGSNEIFSFMFPRTRDRRPVEDFCKMTNVLGNAWWEERRRTNKRYLASLHVLEKASHKKSAPASLRPLEIRKPTRMGNSLTCLKLRKSDLESPELRQIIKSAYRRQAKIHHPDQGGDAAVFRKVHEAYAQLISWSENPTYTKRRGFPDKWFYDGKNNRWTQPTAFRKIVL